MIVDARSAGFGAIETDLCIIGAGPAGITIAREFIGSQARVCMLEAGGFGYEAKTQDFLDGETIGQWSPPREARLAGFGGSTGVWAGWCRPLDAIDFEPRAWVPHSGWPLSRTDLDPYYARAHAVMGLGALDYDASNFASRWLADAEELTTSLFQVTPIRFGRAYRDEIAKADNVQVLLHANVIELCLSESADRLARVRVATPEGGYFEVRAHTFILAAGGIENARLLMLSENGHEGGALNPHGLVGRFFTEHGFMFPGMFIPAEPSFDPGFYRMKGFGVRGALSLSPEVLRRARLLNCAFFLRSAHEAHEAFAAPGVKSMVEVWEKLKRRSVPGAYGAHLLPILRDLDRVAVAIWRKLVIGERAQQRWRLRAYMECAPNPDSRVILGTDKDALGRRRVRVDWRLHDIDIDSIRRACALLDAALRKARVGHLQLTFGDDAEAWRAGVEPGKHNMGTTRMHDDPRQGVVDRHGCIHGMKNFYIAGSSVFPTVGFANPTITIVALALRLADHLRQRLGSRGARRALPLNAATP